MSEVVAGCHQQNRLLGKVPRRIHDDSAADLLYLSIQWATIDFAGGDCFSDRSFWNSRRFWLFFEAFPKIIAVFAAIFYRCCRRYNFCFICGN